MMTPQQAAYLVDTARRAVLEQVMCGAGAAEMAPAYATRSVAAPAETAPAERASADTQPADMPPLPEQFGGVFVTLRTAGRLRGCMGTFSPTASLVETVADVARKSCRDDPRFESNRLRTDEIADVQIDVSVLGSLRATRDPAALVVGRDGLLIRRGSASGCLLPQVAVERNWQAEEFLARCCKEKAGLEANAWRDAGTEVFLFSADVASSASG